MEKRKKGKEAAKKLFSENASPQIGSPTRAKKYPIFVGSIPIPSSFTPSLTQFQNPRY
jgi:hypothetical protein